MCRPWTILFLALLPVLPPAWAQQLAVPPVATPEPGQVLVSGTVADEVSKAAVLARLREVYGNDKVVDQIAVGTVVSPPNWNTYVQKLITPDLKLVSRGQLKIDGNTVSVHGEVVNEAQRQQIASNIATNLNPTYTVNNGLRVAAVEQGMLDALLIKRTIAFESGKATLTPAGRAVLDEIVTVLAGLQGRKIEVIGHTDNLGLRERNLALSRERAETVKRYLADKGTDPDSITASGLGPDRPIAGNDTVDGRARNRRIEFRLAQ